MLKSLDKEKQKQLLVAGVAVALFCAVYAFDLHAPLIEAASSLVGQERVGAPAGEFGGTDGSTEAVAPHSGEQATPENPAKAQGEATSETPAASAASAAATSDSDPAALERALDNGFATLEVSEDLLNEPVWKALDRITGWHSQPSAVKSEHIYSYFNHRKLWVRLAALQFVCAHPNVLAQNSLLIDTLRDKFVRGEHPSQVRRFLERARAADISLYQKMKEILRV